jgi:geranylgeranyl diphosphate synthase type II
MQVSPIVDYIKKTAERIEAELRNAVPSDWDVPPKLREAMEYSLYAGGKRLRPVLAVAAAEALGAPGEAAIPAACAIEMIHTYSLIHDDLPCMDDDDYRRGRLTNHKVFGEGMAILAGDALLTHAFYLAVQASSRFQVPSETVLSIVTDLAYYAGPRGMVGGQAADMLGEQGLTNAEELEWIHMRKTGDLIALSVKAGGRVGGASETQLAALEDYGYKIGLAFQIQDDILDLTGDETKLGKRVKSDEKSKKVTFPYVIGLEESRKKMASLTEEAKEAVRSADLPDPSRLLAIADFLLSRDH